MAKKQPANRTARTAPTTNTPPNAPQGTTLHENGVDVPIYYLLKASAYIDDDRQEANKLVPAGFYKVDRSIPRLDRVRTPDIVKFVGRPDDVFIADIARSRGMHVEAGQKIDYDKLLDTITNVWPY